MRFRLWIVILTLITAAGCQLAAEPTPVPTDTPGPTLTPSPTLPPVRPTLPPSWTPSPTDTPLVDEPCCGPVGTIPPTATQAPGCATFEVIEATSYIPEEGGEAILRWTEVEGAITYHVILDSAEGRVVDEYITETEFSFPSNAFTEIGVYGWQVAPIAPNGDQMCPSWADEIVYISEEPEEEEFEDFGP